MSDMMPSRTCAGSKKNSAQADAQAFQGTRLNRFAEFSLMYMEGMGKNSSAYWAEVPAKAKIDFSNWLIAHKKIDTITDFCRFAPTAVRNFINENDLWEEIGFADKRMPSKSVWRQRNGDSQGNAGW